ncbi:MAG: polysaccharide pyruvyl transferase family protein [Oliverpabstia sp.]
MEKRIGILTFHIAHNYGAMLQAYALPTAVKKMGFECEVIDYRFPYIDSWSRIERWNELVEKYGIFWGGMRFMNRLIHGYYSKHNMHIKFDAFERNIIQHSETIYRSKAELNNMPYDVILFGSDQIWNSALTNGIAEEYIGGFECSPGTKKIAYAASCGKSDFQEDSRTVYYDYLKDFYAIGVREESFCKTLISNGYDAKSVLDPTLLLTSNDWQKIIPKETKAHSNNYLLLYSFDEDEKIYDLTREYAKNHGFQIIVVAYKEKSVMHGMKVKTDCGPLEFLSLFFHAKHVITTSFHGTVFSILFHKEFHCVPHPEYRARTDSLLNMFGLENHNVNKLIEFHDIETNWDEVDIMLEYRRNQSISFLKQAIMMV